MDNPHSRWYLGIFWILQWESLLEITMLVQILPLLMVPLQAIFSNFLEEVMSWVYGQYSILRLSAS